MTSRWFFSNPSLTSRAIDAVTLASASASRAHSMALCSRCFDVDGLEQFDLLVELEVGPPADGVGQRARANGRR